MSRSEYATERLGRPYLAAAAVALFLGATFGLLSAAPHAWPASLPNWLTLQRVRPLHTTFAIAWIFLAYMGALFTFVPRVCGTEWRWPRMARLQLALLLLAGAVAVAGYAAGRFSGREYLDFVPAASALIAAAWALFLANFIATVRCRPRPWPVHLWMWATGLVVFGVTFVEGHLHLLPFYADHPVRDLTVQWKSYGSLIGSWNLVVYGISIYLLERITGDRGVGFARVSFALYWLALANLILGFAHHTYAIPQSIWLRRMSFAMSMTEWAILGHLFWSRLRESTPPVRREAGTAIPALFLRGATFWIGINLLLALLISVPSLNAVTHGTHVTIAHAMGSTIGINTMVLLAAGFAVILERKGATSRSLPGLVVALHGFLLWMFSCLLIAGAVKGRGMYQHGWSFFTAMEAARPFLLAMAVAGAWLWIVMSWICAIWMKGLLSSAEGAAREVALPRPVPAGLWFALAAGIASLPWWFPVAAKPPRMPSYEADGLSEAEQRGRVLFEREGCWKCHMMDPDIPDLRRPTVATSEGWRRVKIVNSAWTGAHARMPSFFHLTGDDLECLLAYLRRIRAVAPPAETAEIRFPFSSPAYDPRRAGDLYRLNCIGCHGEDGRGDGPAAALLFGEDAPRDFTRAAFRTRSTLDLPTDDDLLRMLTYGMPESAMPPFGHLSIEDRWHLVQFVKRLSGRFEWPGRRPVEQPIPEETRPTPELLRRGSDLVDLLRCARCHGDDLRGLDGKANGFVWTDEAERPVRRSTDLTTGVFKSGSSSRDLYRTLYFGRGGSPMPSYADNVPDSKDRWAIVHYLRSLYGK